MKKLTPQQTKVLNCIRDSINKTGFPPTRAEICSELGFSSPNSAETHLRALEKKKYIEIRAGSSRGINILENSQSLRQNENKVPVIGLVAAGSPTLASENIERKLTIDQGMFKKNVDYFLKVKGMSMLDAGILEDDLIAVHKTDKVKNGDLAVMRVNDEVTLKYFYRKNNLLELRPANNDYKSIFVDLEKDDVVLEGLGVGLIRKN